jgi:hypothetical protein
MELPVAVAVQPEREESSWEEQMSARCGIVACSALLVLTACGGGGGGSGGPAPATTGTSGLAGFPTNSFVPSQPAGESFVSSDTDIYADPGTVSVGQAKDSTTTVGITGLATAELNPDPNTRDVRYLALKVTDGARTYNHTFDLNAASASAIAGFLQVLEKPSDGSQHALFINPNLAYSTYGVWLYAPAGGNSSMVGAYSFGQWTPSANVPTSGTATYSGSTIGLLEQPSGNYDLTGDARLTADFSAMTVTGNLTNMKATNNATGVTTPWNNMAMSAAVTSSRNGFAGSISSTSTSTTTPVALSGNVTGHLYGPHAEEIGGSWWATDGASTAAVGSFGAKKTN